LRTDSIIIIKTTNAIIKHNRPTGSLLRSLGISSQCSIAWLLQQKTERNAPNPAAFQQQAVSMHETPQDPRGQNHANSANPVFSIGWHNRIPQANIASVKR
jgi:hypothetical protein